VGLEDDRQSLVSLQRGERPGGRFNPLPALGLFGRIRPRAGKALDRVGLRAACRQQSLPRATHGERLAPGHHLHPGRKLRGTSIGCLRQQDLDRALEGILGVVKADRVAPCGAAERYLARSEQGDRVAVWALPRNPWHRRRGVVRC
jgi:hypothetical protein